MANMPTTLSLVIPIFNEQETLVELYQRLKDVTDLLDDLIQIIFVDDGSSDQSLDLLRDLRRSDPHVHYISLARNFGHQMAVTAGLRHAVGDATIVLDGDLQDPPELIPKMMEKWREGFQVVYAQRTSRRREGYLKKLLAFGFYRVLRVLTDVDIPPDTGDFCLMDRKVVVVLNGLSERERYLRGLRAWVGFNQTAIPFEREPRFAGAVKYTFRKSLRLAINGIVSFSSIPLRLATYLGLLAAGLAVVMMVLVVYWRIFHPTAPLIGYTIITAAIFFLGAVQLLSLGILGEYVGRIYEEIKGRPMYTIKEIAGFEATDSAEAKLSRTANPVW